MTMGSSFGSGSSSASSANCQPEAGVSDQFPAGLRVLVVDDDVTCLRILEQMLRRCLYHVTSCSQATAALNVLRERKGCFDVVLSDVHMPDMDGFKLLELVGLEMDLPVIMMSADGRTNLVLRGIRHGACDYLIKPISEEQLKNIWQHVIRKKWNGNKELENSGSFDDKDRHKRGGDDTDHTSSVNEGVDLISHKKRRNVKEEEDCELENDDPGASKKPRVVWSVELHQQFVSAVNQLGIDKAVPKRILELMNVPGLTRENVASHLQKFRLYLKRLSGVAQHPGGGPNPFCGSIEQNPKLGSYGRFDIQAMAASGQIPPQTLAALHAELLGRPAGNIGLPPVIDQPLPKQISPHVVEDVHSGLGRWQSNNLVGNYGALGGQNGHTMLMGMLQNQQLQKQMITVQPSRLVVPAQPSGGFPAGNSGGLINRKTSINRSSVVDYSLVLPQSDGSLGQRSDGDAKMTGGMADADTRTGGLRQNVVDLGGGCRELGGEKRICFGQSGQMLDQGPLRNLGFVGKGTLIPSRFAVYESEYPTNDLNQGDTRVKQEPNIDTSAIPMTRCISQNDLMSVFSE